MHLTLTHTSFPALGAFPRCEEGVHASPNGLSLALSPKFPGFPSSLCQPQNEHSRSLTGQVLSPDEPQCICSMAIVRPRLQGHYAPAEWMHPLAKAMMKTNGGLEGRHYVLEIWLCLLLGSEGCHLTVQSSACLEERGSITPHTSWGSHHKAAFLPSWRGRPCVTEGLGSASE